MNATQTTPLYPVHLTPTAASAAIGRFAASSTTFPLLGVLVGMVLLSARAPEAGLVPATEIIPFNDTQTDLSLADVVDHFEQHLGAAHKQEAYRLGKLVMEL